MHSFWLVLLLLVHCHDVMVVPLHEVNISFSKLAFDRMQGTTETEIWHKTLHFAIPV